ncbi:uncharacterized protein LOC114535206 [Dendronephthya gigantea]|uniref:uncharacterized protein LOC114535206 n=1 Tax=Dendronephthya gigantea TaxID=151771 RepID=UPI00106C0B2F|nr:uncharacterized protein LOC114535206 [Dendronephthya gigantea]
MPDKRGERINCVLCRSGRQSTATLARARMRKIDWPATTEGSINADQDPQIHTRIDDAFSSVLQYMSVTSRQCRRYFKCSPLHDDHDEEHIKRFHHSKYTSVTYGNPLQKSEDVHVELTPGTYAVTAGQWGAPRNHTQVVRLDPGQTVDMTFTCH